MRIPFKKERILRILCLEKDLSVVKIAKETGLAKSYVSKVIKDLQEKNIVWGAKKLKVEHELLIREWGILKKKLFEESRPLKIDVLIPDRIKEVLDDYVVSGPFAEMLIQGESPGRPLIIYITEKEFEKQRNNILKLGRIGKGQMWIYLYDEHVFLKQWNLKGWKIVNIPQVSADLRALGTYADLGMALFKRWLNADRGI